MPVEPVSRLNFKNPFNIQLSCQLTNIMLRLVELL